MCITGGLVGNRAQSEPLGGVKARALDTAVVERQALRLAVFEVQLAVVHAGQRLGDERPDTSRVHTGPLEEQRVGNGEIGDSLLPLGTVQIWPLALGSERPDRHLSGIWRRCGGSSRGVGTGLSQLSPERALV